MEKQVDNKEKRREKYLKRKEKEKETMRAYYASHKEEFKIRQRTNYLKNKEKILLNNKEYNIKNFNIMAEYKRLWLNNKLKNNPDFRLLSNMRSRVRDALKNNRKSQNTEKLIGCDIDKLKEHLQSQFKEGMSWSNHGFKGWHIDHIKPCASFDLSKPEEQAKCFHYTNLQPLWWYENLQKGDRF